MVKCSVCHREIYDQYKIIYAKELIGIQLPKLYICTKCEYKKRTIEKLKRRIFKNDYKNKEK